MKCKDSSSSSGGSGSGALWIHNNTPENRREHLVWTIGNGDPMHEGCISHSIPRAWKQQEVRADTRVIKSSIKYGKQERRHLD